MNIVPGLINKIKELSANREDFLIAIDGSGGAGKSTLAKHIKKDIPGVRILGMDYYYDPYLKRADYLRVRDEILIPLKNNQKGQSKVYDWRNERFVGGGSVEPGGIIIFEGWYSMAKDLAELYDYRIWIDCPPEEGMKRGLQRDNGAYQDHWENVWVPEMKNYIENQKPQQKADIIINYLDIPKFE